MSGTGELCFDGVDGLPAEMVGEGGPDLGRGWRRHKRKSAALTTKDGISSP